MNASRAARAAGYSKIGGARLLDGKHVPYVRAAIDAALDERARRCQVRADEVLFEIKRIALADPLKAFDEHGVLKTFADIPEDVRRIIAAVDVQEVYEGRGESRVKVGEVKKIKFWDKGAALDKLMRHLGLYRDKLEVSGSVTLRDLLAAPPEPEAEPEEKDLDLEELEDDEVFS